MVFRFIHGAVVVKFGDGVVVGVKVGDGGVWVRALGGCWR